MEKRTFTERLADAQQKAKESPAFIVLATILLLFDGYAHYRWGWDRDWGDTNFALSVEALYNGIFVLMAYAVTSKLATEFQTWLKRQIADLRKLLERLETIFETLRLVLSHLEEIRETVKAILKVVQANGSGAA